MISPRKSKLFRKVIAEPPPLGYNLKAISDSKRQLSTIRCQLKNISCAFQQFKQQTLSLMNEWMSKISTLMYRQIKDKIRLQNQLQKSNQTKNGMRNEVITLQEMINGAMNDYSKDLQVKDREIQKLTDQLHNLQENTNYQQKRHDEILIEQSRKTDQVLQLDTIQEQSSNVTYSSVTTIRDSKEQKSDERIIPETIQQQPQLTQVKEEKENIQPKEHKRTKSFLDHFRKTIEQSFSQKNKDKQQTFYYKISNNNFNQPLQQCGIFPQETKCYSQMLKECHKDPVIFKKSLINCEINQISKSSSSSDLILGDTDKINLPNKFETPTNLILMKKKDPPIYRVMTEPSPQRNTSNSQKNYFSSKPLNSQKKIFCERKSSNQRLSSLQDSKSVKSSGSKEKIKVTAKMIEEMVHIPKKTNTKALVYLGGKSIFRKFLVELKSAFKKYLLTPGTSEQEIKYEGAKRNGLRWGKGRLYYRNGTVYEGQFKQNARHGKGSIFLNGISIYEGLWQMDRLHGEGYIKSMRFMAVSCPSVFHEASYCGNLGQNKLHGIGTIFLNPKQKIVTKFANGCPIGDLTYYNLQQIQFGVWPSD